jgi:predicted transcriptional regulator
MVTKKKLLSDNQRIALDLLAEGPKRWKDLKAITKMNSKTLKVDVLSKLEKYHYVKSLGKRRGYMITRLGMEALQESKAIVYFRYEFGEGIKHFLMQEPSRIDSLFLLRIPLTGKCFVIYSPNKDLERKMAELFGFYIGHGRNLSPEGQKMANVFKDSCRLFMFSFINSGGSQDYLDTMHQAFSKWLP